MIAFYKAIDRMFSDISYDIIRDYGATPEYIIVGSSWESKEDAWAVEYITKEKINKVIEYPLLDGGTKFIDLPNGPEREPTDAPKKSLTIISTFEMIEL